MRTYGGPGGEGLAGSANTGGGAIPLPEDLPLSGPLAKPLGMPMGKPLRGPGFRGGESEGNLSLPLKVPLYGSV